MVQEAAHLVAEQQQEQTMAASLADHVKRIGVQDAHFLISPSRMAGGGVIGKGMDPGE